MLLAASLLMLEAGATESTGGPELSSAGGAVSPKKFRLLNPATNVEEEYEKNEFGQAYLQKEGYTMVLSAFAGAAMKDLFFFLLQFDNTNVKGEPNEQVAIKALNLAVTKYGAVKVIDALNSALESGVRRKVKASKLPTFDTTDKAGKEAQATYLANLRKNEPILFSQEEAEAFKIGDREYSENMLMAKIKELSVDRKGNIDQIMVYMDMLREKLEQGAERSGAEKQ